MRDAYNATTRSELRDGLRLASQRMHRTGAFQDFTLRTAPAPGFDPTRAADIHVDVHESKFTAQTGVTRSTSGVIEWLLEGTVANMFSSAETMRFKVTQRKHDFSVSEAASSLRDRLSAPGAASGAPLTFLPAYEVGFSKPTLFDTPCSLDVALRTEQVDHITKCGFTSAVSEAEVAVNSPSLQHRLAYLCSWRDLVPAVHPEKHFARATAGPVVANGESSVKSSVVYRYRVDNRPLMPVPCSGSLREVTGEFAGIGGDTQFVKAEARAQHHTSFWRYQPDTGFAAPLHHRAQLEAADRRKKHPDRDYLRPDPAAKGLRPHPGPALFGVRKPAVVDGGSYTWADRLAGWLSPGVTVAVSASLGFLKPWGADANRSHGTRLLDRFYLGGPEMTGFDKFGVGPRTTVVAGGNPWGDNIGGDCSAFTSLRLFLPPPLPSVRLANAGVRTELFACAGSLMPRLPSQSSDLTNNLAASVGAAIVVPLLSSVSLQAQWTLARYQNERDVSGSILALVSLW